MGSRAQAQQLWRTGFVAPWHVGSSRTRARTRVPCIGRWILNHCTTKEVPSVIVLRDIGRERVLKAVKAFPIPVLVTVTPEHWNKM